MILKVLIVLILIGYIFHRVASFVFRGMFRGSASRDQFGRQQYSRHTRSAPNSNLNIDNIPNERTKKGDRFGGGEYVDYEEVK